MVDTANQDVNESNWWDIWRRFMDNSQVQPGPPPGGVDVPPGTDVRPSPGMLCSNYAQNSHDDLYKMVTEDVDPSQVTDIGDMYSNAGTAMTNFQHEMNAAVTASTSDWQGSAGNSARQFMTSVGNWAGEAGTASTLISQQSGQQSAALSSAKQSMPEVIHFDVAAANRDLLSTPNPFDAIRKMYGYVDQYNKSKAAHDDAVRVVSSYDSQLEVASTMPAFATPPTLTDPGGPDEPGGHDKGGIDGPNKVPAKVGGGGDGGGNHTYAGPGGGGGSGGYVVPTGGGGGGGSNGGGSNNGGGGSNPPGGVVVPGGGGGNGTNPGTWNPPGTPGYPSTLPGGGGGGGGPTGGGSNNYMPGITPITGGPFTGGEDITRGGGRPFGGSPSGGSGGGGGGGGASGTGAVGGGRPGGGLGAGMGAGAGALAAEQAALGRGGAGAAGAAGRGGAGMGGMGHGGGHGQGGEDEEHQRPSYLLEADPDDVFGTDEMTAPPVIGG
ncbi:WXG100 family type VII secretion target [Actinokineospora enzanensis]|uniref:WXG100 family type VII secretion target n=1 Tax=Actinokineospora enzanensis TaxID=155975 RepID=UPI00035F8553|nr:hypothetical protein [Actinokineospora enzanensis]